jgi:hypothetical protein
MRTIKANIENWYIECLPEDGARISVLQFAGHDLLTIAPTVFKPPEKFYGEFETRPVYGYDDCFPTVDPCIYPNEIFKCRDHGELCWQKWQVNLRGNRLTGHTTCLNPKGSFKRTMEFTGNTIKWEFEVVNLSDSLLPFLHVMHSLMPPNEIRHIEIPPFTDIVDENSAAELDIKTSKELNEHLLDIKPGSFEMLLLKNVSNGHIRLGFRNNIKLKIDYPAELFPTLGIWWNNSGYPDEVGLRRSECAFEPIPGSCSNLSDSFKKGYCLKAEPGKSVNWEVFWEIEESEKNNSTR